jgi:septal ring-binding cell division protein DamX
VNGLIETDIERYADPQSFAREVNLPLLGSARVEAVPSAPGVGRLLAVQAPPELTQVVDGLAETRRSLTLRSLLLAGFAEDPECFAVGLAIAREWSRRKVKVAVVDLDFWHPTIARPGGNEGFVDALLYGCSFRRVAWEVVADALWVVGPGSHPPEVDRLVNHPDWDRVTRGFSAHADVTLYVAPLLDRNGLVGRLSKRMDGVLLTASVERVGRADLRDAFLELWGSDAPIIGCVGIVPADSREAHAPTLPSDEAPAAAPVEPAAPAAPAPPIATPPRASDPDTEGAEADLVATLEQEIRQERSPEIRPKRSYAGLWAGLILAVVIAGSIGVVVLREPRLPKGSLDPNVLPAGEEPVHAPPASPQDAGAGAAPEPAQAPKSPGAAASATPSSPGAPVRSGTSSTLIPPSASSAEKPFTVHVASFKSESKVQGIVRELRLRGAEAWYEPAPGVPGYYRVFVGHFSTEAEAKAHARWLLDNGWVERAQAYPPTER